MTESNTKDAILDAAEQRFADQGFAATSLRTIIRDAGVNTASIHYHFGSREGLIEAVLLRRATPVNADRLRRLDAIEALRPSGPLPLEEVLEAWLEPVIRAQMGEGGGDRLRRLMGRFVVEAGYELGPVIYRNFQPVLERFVAALQRTVVAVPVDELLSRMHFVIGSMAFAVSAPGPQVTGDVLLRRLVRFAAAGIAAAPLTAQKEIR